MLTAERLREVLNYIPETGVFTRKTAPPCISSLIGTIVGSDTGSGYLRISIDGNAYAAHRLAWLHQTGCWPIHHIDHKNGIKSDNRFDNLRDVPNRVNGHNRKGANRNSQSGLLGAIPKHGKWIAVIYTSQDLTRKRHHLGYFATAEEAHFAYLAAKQVLHIDGKAGGA